MSADTHKLSHACIIAAASRQEALSAAKNIAQKALCVGIDPPCGVCRGCRKVSDGIHPDVIFVSRPLDDKGREKREITVDQVRLMSSDAAILPNEAERKVYIIDQADTMNPAAQNAALKLLEEPPNGAMFLLCVTNPQGLLSTVRSRCTEINMAGESEQFDEATVKLAEGYIKAVESRDITAVFSFCAANDGIDTRSASDFIACADGMIADRICARARSSLCREELMALHGLTDRCARYLRVNTGVKHIFGLLAVDSLSAEKSEDK